MKTRPFVNVAWNRPFLPALIDIALDLTGGDIGKAFCVFPHTRPALYMTDAIRNDSRIPKPCVLPVMDSVSGLFTRIRSAAGYGTRRGATPVGTLDQVALLLGVVRELGHMRGGLLRALPLNDSRRFFPWGVRLAGLMEEVFTHNRVPEDYIHMEGQVTPFAAALLENLGAIHARYTESLRERGWTTPGFDAVAVVHALEQGEDIAAIPGIAGKTIILAGFHTLTGSQQILFRHLWERHEATVCLHADPAVVHGSPHWSCTDFIRWAGAWRTTITPYTDGTPEDLRVPEIAFRAGYDVHSQIAELAKDLAETEYHEGESRAVVLPDTSLLLPVLHHLPDADRNISMGYPLARSPLFRLVESILSLQETRRGTGPFSYHWKALIDLLRHPYLKMLVPASEGEKEPGRSRDFRRFLHSAERVVRTSRRFAPVTDLCARSAATFTEADGEEPAESLAALFDRILDAAVFHWEDITTPGGLAAALQELTNLMRDHGGTLWSHFPIDAECLYRLTESVIPQLAHTALKEEHLPPETLFAVLRELLAEERVPFEAYPLVGDQVLGVLETRLLHFDRVFVLDLTEDKLPGTGGHDPLLPDSLRPFVGLPGKQGREKIAAYNFFRLINSASRVTMYWQEGVAPQGLNDAKKMRSRFVEELLWREEEKRGRILAPERPENGGTDGPLRLVSCILPAVPHGYGTIPSTPQTKHRMRALLETEISPSLLDAYLRCPARFFYQRIGRIREVEGVVEGRDPVGTGTFLHDVLRNYFTERRNLPVTTDASAFAALRDTFLKDFANSDLFRTLPADERIMLEEATPPILRNLLENHAGRTPRHIEAKFQAGIAAGGRTRTLSGVIDRVDEDAAGLIILDYKTGHIPLVNGSVWHDEPFWQSLREWTPGQGDEVLDALAREFASVQLPAYIHMVREHTGMPVYDAAYVPLRMGAKDSLLFGEKMDADAREKAVTDHIPLLFSFLLRHMENAETFAPKPGQNCDWCLYKNLCILMA